MTRTATILLTTSYPQSGDGSEAAGSFVRDIAQRMSRDREVRIVAPGTREGVDGEPSLQVWRFAAGVRALSLLDARNPLDWVAILRTLASMRRQALRASADGKVAHIYALWVLPSGWAARVVARRWSIGYSVWALGSDIWTLGRLPLARSLLAKVARDADHAFADGLALARDGAKLSSRPFAFLPSTRAIPVSGYGPARTAPPYRLAFLGRWHPNKGIDLLCEALAQLDDSAWSRIEVVRIHGGGGLAPLVERGVRALQEKGRPVEVTGYLDKDESIRALANADWLVIPSRVESIPLVFSDAVKIGLPVVTTPVGDLRELVLEGDGCGVVAADVSAAAIAQAIVVALESSPADYRDGLRVMAAKFDLDQVVRMLVQAGGLPDAASN